MGAARPTKLIGRFPHRNYDVAQHHPGDGLNNESHECVAKVLTGFWDMLADQGFITPDGAEKLKSCVKVFDQVRLVGVPISFVKCVTLTNYASQHPLAQITRRGRVEVDFDDEAERLCGGAKGVADLLALHHARLELMLKIWRLAHGKPLAVRSRRPAVPRCLHAIDATCVHQTRSWVVSFSILRPFGPILRAGHRVGRVRARARRDSRGGRSGGVPRPRHAPGVPLAPDDGHQEAAQGGQVGALRPLEGEAF